MNRWTKYLQGEGRDRYIKKYCDVLKGYNYSDKHTITQTQLYAKNKYGDSKWKWALFYHTLTYMLQQEQSAIDIGDLEDLFIDYKIHPEFNSVSTIRKNWKKLMLFFDNSEICLLRQCAYISGFFE